jgi:hypothetical protein
MHVHIQARKRGIYFGTILTYKNCIHEEIRDRLNFRIVVSLSVIYGLKLYKAITSAVVLRGCEIWSLILTEEHAWSVFENSVLRRIFGPKKQKVTASQENNTMRRLVTFTPRQILLA